MASAGLGVVIVALVATRVCAEVVLRDGVPFTAAELTAALAVRGGPAAALTVRSVSPNAVEIATAIGRQRVELGDLTGSAAARLVALQVAPLRLERDSFAESPPVPMSGVSPVRGLRFGVAAGGGYSATSLGFALTAVRADATWARERWRWGASVAWMHGLARAIDPADPATADLGVVRGYAGIAMGPLELVGGPALAAYRVTASSPGLTFGAGGSARLVVVDGGRWRAIASAEVDLLRHRVVVERNGVAFAASPHVALTATVGVAWAGL
jgi:hypothetical protein